jgi:enterochelin esterase-like enzyme
MILGLALAVLWGRAILLMPATEPLPTVATTASAQTVVPTLRPVVISPLATPTRSPTRTPQPATNAPPPAPTAGADLARCTEITGQVISGTFSSHVSNTQQRYLIYLPPCYDHTETRYPTIYLFHGSDNDETHWQRLGIFQAMDEGLRAGRFPPAIIVLPDGNYDLFMHTSGGPGSYEAEFVDDLIPYIDSTYRTVATSEWRAIGGISRGGVWSYEIGFRHPDLFAIVGGHSAALNVNLAPPGLDPINMADLPSLKEQRIWLDVGDADYTWPGVEQLHLALDRSSVEHTYKIFPGAHDDSLWAAHLADYLEFYTLAWHGPGSGSTTLSP